LRRSNAGMCAGVCAASEPTATQACRGRVQATHSIRAEVESQHHVLDRMVRRSRTQGVGRCVFSSWRVAASLARWQRP
jgi:hypothetical protein